MAVPTLKKCSGNSASTTLSVAMANSDTTATLTSDTAFAAAEGEGMIIIDESQATEELAYATGKTGAVLSIPLANRGLEGGAAQGHAINATVKGILSASMWNDLIDALTNVLDQTTGAVDTTKVVTLTGTQILTNKTLTLPQINDTSSDHQYIFAVGELAADRTVTLPVLTGNDEFLFADHTKTLTNKRITKRVTTITTSATPTVNTDNCDVVTITAQGEEITSMTSGLSGTPTNFQTLVYRILDDGTGRAITWGDSFQAMGVALPTTTTANKVLTVGFIYDSVDSKWGCVASVTEA